MAVTKEDVEQAKQDAKNERNQRRMEKDVFGNVPPMPNPKSDRQTAPQNLPGKPEKKKGFGEGAVNYRSGGSVSSRADGCAQRGKTRGRMV